jgi:hypothetical protein
MTHPRSLIPALGIITIPASLDVPSVPPADATTGCASIAHRASSRRALPSLIARASRGVSTRRAVAGVGHAGDRD